MSVNRMLRVLFLGALLVVSFKPSDPISAGILFYNVENLFDTTDDTLKMDEGFLPGSVRRWTYRRKEEKLNHISKVLMYAGGWNPPVLVGLCEIENQEVLKSLIWNTGLNHLDYKIIHFSSGDERGIDVALLYRSNRFKVLDSYPVKISLGQKERPTRDILFVKGVLDGRDTLQVMVNHWPSRYGGAGATSFKRLVAAKRLKRLCDSVQSLYPKAKIVMMGDFNDEPRDKSLLTLTKEGTGTSRSLINLALQAEGAVPGTIKYRGQWSFFDQMIVSGSLLSDTTGLHVENKKLQIVAPDFLLEEDPDFPGVRPSRTYRGYRYAGGYSDHLPVIIYLSRP